MKQLLTYVLAFNVMLLLIGCGTNQQTISQNFIEIDNYGLVNVVLNESFEESYYDLNELNQMVNDELTTYNSIHGVDSIVLKDSKLENGIVSLNLEFSGAEDYNEYMSDSVYIGNINGAYLQGYDFNRALCVAGNEEAIIGKNDLLNMADSKVIVVDGLYTVRCPSKIMYYSQNMRLIDSYTVESNVAGCYFVIYK